MNQEGDHKNCVSQLYPRLYTPGVQRTEAVEVKASRRRRRKSKKEGSVVGERKRKLSDEQVRFLELSFANEHKLESERKDKLALQLGLDPRQIAVWFQNKRARWKNQKLEQEYSKLKSAHEIVIIEKCRLETEVLKLKEQVSEAEKRMQKLSESFYGVSTSSSSSTSAETDEQQTFIHDFMVDEFNSLFYVPDYSYIYDLVSYGL